MNNLQKPEIKAAAAIYTAEYRKTEKPCIILTLNLGGSCWREPGLSHFTKRSRMFPQMRDSPYSLPKTAQKTHSSG
jgi:hypothetical protein